MTDQIDLVLRDSLLRLPRDDLGLADPDGCLRAASTSGQKSAGKGCGIYT
jgi:hypothetical protein